MRDGIVVYLACGPFTDFLSKEIILKCICIRSCGDCSIFKLAGKQYSFVDVVTCDHQQWVAIFLKNVPKTPWIYISQFNRRAIEELPTIRDLQQLRQHYRAILLSCNAGIKNWKASRNPAKILLERLAIRSLLHPDSCSLRGIIITKNYEAWKVLHSSKWHRHTRLASTDVWFIQYFDFSFCKLPLSSTLTVRFCFQSIRNI